MALNYRVVGWGGSSTCECGNPPCAIVEPIFETREQGFESGYNYPEEVCKPCLGRLNVVEDKVADVFEGLGL